MNKESEIWDNCAEDYDQKVFSLTKSQIRCEQLVGDEPFEKALNLGCGSEPYLNKELVKRSNGKYVYASDFSRKMLEVSKSQFSEGVQFFFKDSKDTAFKDKTFDLIVSANSILPPEVGDVFLMFKEAYRLLTDGGTFRAFLPSFENAVMAKIRYLPSLKLDDMDFRVNDGDNWQCFHTENSIIEFCRLLGKVFSVKYEIETVYLNTPEEIEELKNIYGVDTSEYPIYEYLLTAIKDVKK